MIQFFGKFHPLLVHLPIGVFIFGVFLKGYVVFKKQEVDERIFKLIIAATVISSLLSVVTGLILFSGGDYEKDTVLFHRNMGIVFTAVSVLIYFFNQKRWSIVIWLFGLVVLLFTGHLGGNLTHGEDYLTLELSKPQRKPIANVQEAKVFDDLVRPILEEKCWSCHSSKKQKGKLRLDEKEFILKGGKNGKCIDPLNSLLLERLNLPDGEEEHMPPKGKPQLSNQEKQILDWWIKNGADFNKKAKEISQTPADKKALLSFQSGENFTVSESIIPEKKVSEPSKTALEILQKAGVVVNRISPETNYITITVFENRLQEKEISALKELKKNILILIARGHKDKNLIAEIGNFSNLRKLNLAESGITDDDLNKFSSLAELRDINLGGTAVTEKGLLNLKTLGKLKTIFVYNSKFNKKQFKQLKAQFPKTRIDTGGYQISQSDSLKFVM